jgi:DNA repair and recombination protein RAD52
VDFVDVQDGKYSIGISSVVRVTLKDGSYHEDCGYGSIEHCRQKAAAFEKAKKESVTDALKRTLRHFGNALGNCVYSKEYLKKIGRIGMPPPSPIDPTKLYRGREYPAAAKPDSSTTANASETISEQSKPRLATNDPTEENGYGLSGKPN